MITLLYYFLLLISVVIISSIVGKVILAGINIKTLSFFYINFFIEQIIAISLCTIFYALYKTRGDTILLCLLILFIFLYWEYRNKENFSSDTFINRLKERFNFANGIKYLEILLLLTVYFAWQSISIASFSKGIFVPCNADLHFIARITDAINISGIERFCPIDISPAVNTPAVPYHYFEIWFIALVSNFSTHLPLFIVKLIMVPVFLMNLYCIIVYMIHALDIKPWWFLKIMAATYIFFKLPLFLVSAGNSIGFKYDEYPFLKTGVAYEPLLYKTIHLEIITFAALIFFMKQRPLSAVLCLLMYVVVCYTSVPVLLPAILLYAFIGLIMKIKRVPDKFFLKKWYQNLSRADIYKVFFYTFITIIFIKSFYYFNSDPSIHSFKDNYSLANILTYYKNFQNIERSVKPFINNIFELREIVLPVIFLLLFVRMKGKKNTDAIIKNSMWVLWISTVILSLVASYLFIFNYDYFVLYRITNLPVMCSISLLAILLFYKEWETSKYVKYIPIIILAVNIIFNFYNGFHEDISHKKYMANEMDKAYIDKVSKIIKELPTEGVSMFSEDTITEKNIKNEYDINYTNTSYNQRFIHVFFPLGLFLNYYKPYVIVHPITFTPPMDSNLRNKLIRVHAYYPEKNINNDSYYSSYCKNILKEKNLSETEKQISFIKYVNAGYLIATRYAKVPEQIRTLLSDSVINKISGERFYVINKSLKN